MCISLCFAYRYKRVRVCVIGSTAICLCSIWRLQEITGVLQKECVSAFCRMEKGVKFSTSHKASSDIVCGVACVLQHIGFEMKQ